MVDADLSKYFDTIPHSDLMKCVARRIVDRHALRLIKLWLKAPIEDLDDNDGTRRIGGGKQNARGTPQGGVASPLLANIYMNRFLKYWRLTRRGEAFRAHVIAYADDFVILSRGCAAEALAWTKTVMTRLGLTLNEAKTSLRNARHERFVAPRSIAGPGNCCPRAFRPGRQAYCSGGGSASKIGSSTSIAAVMQTRSRKVEPLARVVCNRGGLFQDGIGRDHFGGNQVLPNAEMLKRALGLSPQSLSTGTSTTPKLSVSFRVPVMRVLSLWLPTKAGR